MKIGASLFDCFVAHIMAVEMASLADATLLLTLLLFLSPTGK